MNGGGRGMKWVEGREGSEGVGGVGGRGRDAGGGQRC